MYTHIHPPPNVTTHHHHIEIAGWAAPSGRTCWSPSSSSSAVRTHKHIICVYIYMSVCLYIHVYVYNVYICIHIHRHHSLTHIFSPPPTTTTHNKGSLTGFMVIPSQTPPVYRAIQNVIFLRCVLSLSCPVRTRCIHTWYYAPYLQTTNNNKHKYEHIKNKQICLRRRRACAIQRHRPARHRPGQSVSRPLDSVETTTTSSNWMEMGCCGLVF